MKLLLKLAATATVSALALTACGTDAPDTSATNNPTGAETAAGSTIPTPQVSRDIPEANVDGSALETDSVEGEITFMTQGLKGTFDDFFTGLIADFEAENAGTTITWTDQGGSEDFDTLMVTQASNCSMADVINVPSSTMLALSKGNFLLDLDTKMPGVGDKFVPDVWNSIGLGADGAHTALPWYFGPFIVTYNKTVFENAGLDPDAPPATMDEYFEFAKQVADKTDDYAIYGNTSWYMVPQLRAYGVEMMNEDATEFTFASDAQALKWVTNMAELYKAGGIPQDSITGDLDMSKAYGDGNLAYGSPNASFIRNVQANAPAVYDVTGAGSDPRNEGIKPLFNGQFVGVSVTSENSALAAKWAEYLTNTENGLAWAKYGIDTETAVAFPVATEALNDPSLTEGDATDAFTQGRIAAAKDAQEAEAYLPLFYVTGAVRDALVNNVNQAIVGQIEPQAALDGAQEEMNSLLERLLSN